MYAARVECCRLVSHVEYAPRALLRFEKDETVGRTDARPLHYVYRYTRLSNNRVRLASKLYIT